MSASDHLSGDQFMYHISPQHYRKGIQRAGLIGENNFVSSEPLNGDGDVWRVNTSGLPLQHDTGFEEVEGERELVQTRRPGWKSYYTSEKIPPHRMELVAHSIKVKPTRSFNGR